VLPWNAPNLEEPSQPIPAILAATPPRESQPTAQVTPGSSTMLPMDISLSDYLEDIEKRTILQALEKTNNNKTAAAKLLGISFRTLRYRLSKLGLSKEQDADLDDAEGDEE
jgi:two-component system, NtrC family, response regulator PilR